MAAEVLYDVRDRVALITLNRPEYAHVAHAHNAEVSGHSLAGLDARGMRGAAPP
jgi:enoyl-CoA hydratase/carnithine racemase